MIGTFKSKYKKYFKSRIKRDAKSKYNLLAGSSYGLKAMDAVRITSKQIESVRKVLSRHLKKFGAKIIINIYPDYPVTKKPTDVRMGKGKGSVEYWVARVRPGTIMFEIIGVDNEFVVNSALISAKGKLPVQCKLVSINNEMR